MVQGSRFTVQDVREFKNKVTDINVIMIYGKERE